MWAPWTDRHINPFTISWGSPLEENINFSSIQCCGSGSGIILVTWIRITWKSGSAPSFISWIRIRIHQSDANLQHCLYLQHWRVALEAAQAMSSSPEVPPTLSTNDQGSVRAFARLAIQEGFYFVLRHSAFLLHFSLARLCNFFCGAAFSILLYFMRQSLKKGLWISNFVRVISFLHCSLIIWPLDGTSAWTRSAPEWVRIGHSFNSMWFNKKKNLKLRCTKFYLVSNLG